jgi:transcriptional regulator with XRE-family HTH domain
MLAKENIRLTFGFKVKQLRQERGMSLSDLAQKTNISVSYLNEIEKGKKYPQAEKIAALAEALDVSYDWLVSLKLNKKLSPLSSLLQSNFLSDFPLEVFGIESAQFIEILANAPDKIGAFLGTLAEIARSYDMQIEEFYFSVLRSYQEMYENYFPDLEQEVSNFREAFSQSQEMLLSATFLTDILEKKYQIEIKETLFEGALENLRSVLKGKTLLINKNLNEEQRRFVLAREIGYNFLKIKKRAFTFSWVEVHSFDEVLNNFKASYFAGALLLPELLLKADLEDFFSQKSFEADKLLSYLRKYEVSPETFLYRCSNLLPRYFGLNEIFFLRFDNTDEQFNLTKEMHLAGLHNPHASALGEHYCRRWISISILQELQNTTLPNERVLCQAQISDYYDSPNQYLVVAMARSLSPTPALSSLAIGIKINENAQKAISFLNDTQITRKKVGETCERCSAQDCKERIAKASILEKKRYKQTRKQAIRQILQ